MWSGDSGPSICLNQMSLVFCKWTGPKLKFQPCGENAATILDLINKQAGPLGFDRLLLAQYGHVNVCQKFMATTHVTLPSIKRYGPSEL